MTLGTAAAPDVLSAQAVAALQGRFRARMDDTVARVMKDAGVEQHPQAAEIKNALGGLLVACAQGKDAPPPEKDLAGGLTGAKPLDYIAAMRAIFASKPAFSADVETQIARAAQSRTEGAQLDRIFDGQDRLYLKLAQAANPVQDAVAAALSEDGYTLSDYKKGYATDGAGKQQFRIGKLLQNIRPDLLDAYTNDTSRTADKLLVVISRKADDIARMSVNRGWLSCMTQQGGKFDRIYDDIKQGALIAYLVRERDPEIYDPLARILIKPYEKAGIPVARTLARSFGLAAAPDMGDIAYLAHRPYGLKSAEFTQTVQRFVADTLNAGHSGRYQLLPRLYRDVEIPARFRI